MSPPPDARSPKPRHAPLEMSPDEFRAVGHRVVDQLADLLAQLPHRPVTPAESPHAVREALGADTPLPTRGQDTAGLLDASISQLADHSLFNGHPRFFGYITSSAAPIGAFGDLVAAAINPNVGGWTLSPFASEIEAQTVRWIAELIGYPTTAGGLLVSGGNVANLIGLLAGRTAQASWNVREKGLAGGPGPLCVYASQETHTWIQKATDLSGLGTDAIRWIRTDDQQRLDLAALRQQVDTDRQAGAVPFMVVGTAGSVSTGAVDPLPALAEVCRELGLWFHVDGAYGAAAALAEGAPADLAGLRDADSVAIDPHKWLYAPLEAGCVLVRDAAHLRGAFSYHPVYYHLEDEALNYFDIGLQNSRGFRALKVWLALRQVGREGYMRMIADDIRLSASLFAQVSDHEELEGLTQSLSIATFRYVPPDLRARASEATVARYLNQLNEQLLTRIEESGEAFLSNAVINETYALRACIVNFRTSQQDVDALPALVVRLGRATDAALRPDAQ